MKKRIKKKTEKNKSKNKSTAKKSKVRKSHVKKCKTKTIQKRKNKNRRDNNRLHVNKIKIETTSKNLIDCAGIIPFMLFLNKFGFFKLVDKRLHLPKRIEGYRASDIIKIIFANILIFSSNPRLQNIDLLRENEGLKMILEMKDIPSSTTVGRFLYKYANVNLNKKNERLGHENGLELLGNLFCETAVITLKEMGKDINPVLDIDAFIIDENKKYSKWTYKKGKGTTGYGGFIDGVCVMLELEPGNHSPNDNIFKRTISAIEIAKKAGINIQIVREDAAGYVADLINYCEENEIKFYIRASNDDAVKKSIMTIVPRKEGKKRGYEGEQLESCWKEAEIKIAGNNKTTTKTIGVAVHAMDKTNAFNLVTQRTEIITKPEKPDLTKLPTFENDPEIQYICRAIATNDLKNSGKKVTEIYNQRGDASENYNKELVGGFGLGDLPAGGEYGLEVNRGYAYIIGMLYNLMHIYKKNCFDDIENEFQKETEKETEKETDKKVGKKVGKKQEHNYRLSTLTRNFFRIPAIVSSHSKILTITMANYMEEKADLLDLLLEEVKEKIKVHRTPKEPPNYIQLIFRNNSGLATAGGVPLSAVEIKKDE